MAGSIWYVLRYIGPHHGTEDDISYQPCDMHPFAMRYCVHRFGPLRLWNLSIFGKKKQTGMAEIFDDFEEFARELPQMVALVGLDLGTVTLGVAVSDSFLSVATPLETIKRKKFTLDAQALLTIMDKRSVGGIVLGLPLNMDGSEGPRVQSTRAFARNLSRLTEVPITFWDERLSTVAAERALLEADTSRKRRAEVIDHVAAGYILQGALDRIRYIRQGS